MRVDLEDLSRPWERGQLVVLLEHLVDLPWLAQALAGDPALDYQVPTPESETFDALLDFFDSSGVLDSPDDEIGAVLLDDHEADLFAELGHAVDVAINHCPVWVERKSDVWYDVGNAAKAVLEVFRARESGSY